MSSYPLYNWSLEPTISFSYAGAGSSVIGNPALVIDSQENTYFAAVVIGQNPTASPSVPSTYQVYYNIVVGSSDSNGNLLWYKFFPELVVAANQTQVALAIGNNNDLYVAFVTPSAVSGCYNMYGIPAQWCPPLYVATSNPTGPYDIVLARINYTSSSQTVAWFLQNARLNSVWNETAPQLAIDTNTGLLYVTYQTNGDILCYTSVGTTNVAVSCFTLNGTQLWLECQQNINSTGANTNPTIAADLSGGVYIAYQTTATVSGGASITSRQIEMVKFQTFLTSTGALSSYSRQWVLSSSATPNILATGGTSSLPSLTSDGTNTYIAFLTTGVVGSNYHTGSTNDLVVAKITKAGNTVWIQQGSQFNRAPYTYSDSTMPYITTESLVSPTYVPNILVSLQTSSGSFTTIPPSGSVNVFIFKLAPTTGYNMFDYNGFNNMPLAYTSASTALLPTAGPNYYSQVAIKAIYTSIFFLLGSLIPLPFYTITSCEADLILLKYDLVNYYPNVSPFQFMTSNKKICSCGANCACGSSTTVPSAPANVVATPATQSAILTFTQPSDGGNSLINYAYSINGITPSTPFGPPQFASPVIITGLITGTSYSIQLQAINGIGYGPASTAVTVTPT